MNYFKKFSKLNVKYKDKVIPVLPLFLAVISLFMITIGGSYAYLTSVEESELVNRITAGTLELTFSTKDNSINLINAVPQEDSVALSENDEYTFNIKNSGNITTYYEMRLEDVCEVGNEINGEIVDNCIPLEFVRVALKKGEGEYVIKHMNEEGSVLLDVDTLNGGTDSDSFSLKIWLDINTPNTYNDKEKNIVFASKLTLYAEQRYVQKVGSECLVIEDNKIVDYTCSYSDIEIDSNLVNNVTQTSNNKIYRPKKLDNINNYSEVELVDNVVVDTIASEAFKSKGLRSIIINSNITTIEDNAFLDNPSLKDVVMGSINLSENSFTTGGEIISIKDLNGEFPASCFNISTGGTLEQYNCKDAVNIVIPFKDKTNTYEVKSIKQNTFENLGLKSVDFSIAATLSSIENYAFYGNKVKIIDFSNNASLTRLGSYSFETSGAYSLFLPDNITSILPRAFAYNNLTSVVIPDGVSSIGVGAFQMNNIEKVVLSDSLTKIDVQAFYTNKLKEIKLPNSLTTIGSYAFSKNNLESLVIPDNVTSIGGSAFYMNKIESVYLSKNLASVPSAAFRDNLLKSVVIPEGVTEIGVRAFQNNLLEKVVVSDNVTIIDEQAFQYNKIQKIKLSGSLVTIGYSAFDNNEINGILFPDTLTSIGSYAFNGNKIVELVIPNSVTEIGVYAFANNSIKQVVLSNNLKILNNRLFVNNDIANVEIPDSVETIGDGVFYSNDLDKVVIPDSVKTISDNAFYNNRIYDLTLGENVQTIGKWAFAKNNLSEVVIPVSIISIGEAAFRKGVDHNINLSKIINLTGREFDWNFIIDGVEGTPSITATVNGVSIVSE